MSAQLPPPFGRKFTKKEVLYSTTAPPPIVQDSRRRHITNGVVRSMGTAPDRPAVHMDNKRNGTDNKVVTRMTFAPHVLGIGAPPPGLYRA